jgi:Mce-associated membrane protein
VISCFSVHDPEGPDTAHGDDPEGAIDPDELQSRSGVDSGTEAFVSEADAEDEVAKAEARVESARARLERLRRAAAGDVDDDDACHDAADTQDVEQRPTKSIRTRLRGWRRSRRPRRLRRPGRKAVAVAAGFALVSTSLGAIGYMLQQHHNIAHKRQLSQEYAAAARQAVTTLMSIDANHAKDDIQRIIDASTGPLKDQMSVMSSLMLKQAEESKTITKVNVEAVAVESATDNSAVALVVAKTDVTDTGSPRPPQLWRLSIELVRDGGQLKMSKVDFLQ